VGRILPPVGATAAAVRSPTTASTVTE